MKTRIVCSSLKVDGEPIPEEVKILPLGNVHTTEGDFIVDDESTARILKQYQGRKLDLVIDYEHQTLKNVQAPAAGWIKDIYQGRDALVAKVEWTPKAEEYLKNKEYRYLSPVVIVRDRDKRAISLHSVALTNTPAINGMFAMVNAADIDSMMNADEDEGGEEEMELSKLIKILGLSEMATEEEVVEAIVKLTAEEAKAGNSEKNQEEQEKTEVVANSTVLRLLGLDEEAKTEDAAAAIMALKAGRSKDTKTLMELKEKLEKKEASEAVEKALKDGKITAAQTEWATTYALKDPTGFKKFVEKAPVVVHNGKMDIVTSEKEGQERVSVAVLKSLGLTAEEIKKFADKEETDE